MNDELRKRIDSINKGIVPEGYKRCSHSIIPIEWNETKLDRILTQRKTLLCASKDNPLLSFTIEEGVIEPANKKTNKRDFLIKDISTKKFALTEKGDLIYNPANLKFGAIHVNKLRRGVVSPIYGIFYSTQNSNYLGYLLHNQDFINYAKVFTEGTVEKLKTLKAENFLNLKVVLPSLEEQQKIAQILSTQDKLISLQERKVEELKNLKKAYLSKMFPKKGSKYPELRFKGFTDAWEQREVGELAESTYGGGTPNTSTAEYWNGNIPWIQSSDITEHQLFDVVPKKHISSTGLSKSATKLVPENSIAIVTRVGVGKLAILPFSYTTSQDFLSLSNLNIDINFGGYLLYKKMQSELNAVQGTSIKGVTKEELLKKKVFAPSPKEQQLIGTYFKNLDTLITLHQRKLDAEKLKKKALMQLLLTGKVRV